MLKHCKIGTGRLLAAGGLVALLFLSGCGRQDDADPVKTASKTYPAQLPLRAQLRNPAAGEALRLTQYDPVSDSGAPGQWHFDDQARSHAVVQYRDTHKTALIDYRTDGPGTGKIKSVKVLYPAPEKSNVRQVARLLQLDVDGRTIISDVQYQPDGKTVAHTGNRTAAGVFESYDFQTDGTSVAHHKRFTLVNKAWQLALDETYGANNSLVAVTTLLPDGSHATDTYNDQHVLASRLVKNADDSLETTENYLADGKTVSSKVTVDSSSVAVDTFENGVLVTHRNWGYGYNTMTVTVYHNGKPAYRQNWSLNSGADTKKLDPSSYTLQSIDKLNADAKVTETITLAADGKTPSSIRVNDPANLDGSAHTQKTFADDGTLQKVETYDKDGKVTKTDTHTPADKIRETVPEKMLETHPFAQPPAMLPTKYPYGGYGEYPYDD
ncbi:MAG TPA: hypothetical protein V6C69_02345 [Trichormus sp.]